MGSPRFLFAATGDRRAGRAPRPDFTWRHGLTGRFACCCWIRTCVRRWIRLLRTFYFFSGRVSFGFGVAGSCGETVASYARSRPWAKDKKKE